ncbi:GTPase [Helicobacter pylori]|uniref:GTPase n=1 Tax=Helicobacter pylori TaxID=210 RepID=UPI002F2B4F68
MKKIYSDVEKSIKDLQKIFENTDGGDERLRKFNQKALEKFKNLESESLKGLESLKNNEEWEKFTIAFYGETGLYANMKNYRGSEHTELEKLQDGAIIGDGRSDSTLETKPYTLKHNNQSFVLLDVPGIEGDEKKLNSKFLTLQKKPMLFFMLQKHPLLRKKEKREKRERLKRSKTNSIRKQRYIP